MVGLSVLCPSVYPYLHVYPTTQAVRMLLGLCSAPCNPQTPQINIHPLGSVHISLQWGKVEGKSTSHSRNTKQSLVVKYSSSIFLEVLPAPQLYVLPGAREPNSKARVEE